jgi:hypothetical protein
MSERQLRAALAGIAPFAEDDFYPNCATPEYRAAVEAMRAALAAPDAADAEVAALRADRDRMRAAIVDLLRIEEDAGLFDTPGEYWDEGDGYIASNSETASAELKAVLARLRACVNDGANAEGKGRK